MTELNHLATQELVELKKELFQREDYNAPAIEAIEQELEKRQVEKYPDGYLPKIAYWMWLGNLVKVDYFREQQIKKYGPISPDDYETVARLYNEIEAFETMDVGVPLSEATVEEWFETEK